MGVFGDHTGCLGVLCVRGTRTTPLANTAFLSPSPHPASGICARKPPGQADEKGTSLVHRQLISPLPRRRRRRHRRRRWCRRPFASSLLTLDPSRSLTRPRADQQPFAPNYRLQPIILLAQSLIPTPRPYPPARSPSAPASRRFRRFLALTTAQHEL